MSSCYMFGRRIGREDGWFCQSNVIETVSEEPACHPILQLFLPLLSHRNALSAVLALPDCAAAHHSHHGRHGPSFHQFRPTTPAPANFAWLCSSISCGSGCCQRPVARLGLDCLATPPSARSLSSLAKPLEKEKEKEEWCKREKMALESIEKAQSWNTKMTPYNVEVGQIGLHFFWRICSPCIS